MADNAVDALPGSDEGQAEVGANQVGSDEAKQEQPTTHAADTGVTVQEVPPAPEDVEAGKREGEETLKPRVSMTKGGRASIFSPRAGHALEFDDVSLCTKSKNPEKKPPKVILDRISGSFPPKALTAVMGPSGSGKTSLLKFLTGRIGGSSKLDLRGKMRLDGKEVDPTDISVRRKIAYVEQDVSIPATCTPREAIGFSARLRLDPKLTDAEVADVVDDILDNLGLQGVADTIIGGGPLMSGGLSGGEKKRVQCGVELVTNPTLVVLDEPTSGLDSYSAQSLMVFLKKIADAGATVVVTIHQPPPPVVRKIDGLFLLLGGRALYQGKMGPPVERAFEERGFPKPEDYNVADWILQVAQTNSKEDLEKAGFFDGGGEDSPEVPEVPEVPAPGAGAAEDCAVPAAADGGVGLAVQTRLLFDRELKKLRRDKLGTVVRITSNTLFGLLFGLIFLSVGRSDYVAYPEVMASFGAIANLLISTMFGVAQGSLMEFPKDRPVFLREYSTNHYSVVPYFIAKFSLECVTVMTQVLAQLVAAFFLMGFQTNFFAFLALNFMLAIASTSIGIFIGSLVEDPAVAAELMPALIVPQLLFSGFFIQVDLIPEFLRWAQYLCSLTYAIRLAALYEFGSEECGTFSCQNLLDSNGVYELESYWYWIILFGIAAIFRLTSVVILKKKASF